ASGCKSPGGAETSGRSPAAFRSECSADFSARSGILEQPLFRHFVTLQPLTYRATLTYWLPAAPKCTFAPVVRELMLRGGENRRRSPTKRRSTPFPEGPARRPAFMLIAATSPRC